MLVPYTQLVSPYFYTFQADQHKSGCHLLLYRYYIIIDYSPHTVHIWFFLFFIYLLPI